MSKRNTEEVSDKVSLLDFIIKEKVDAFTDTYEPATESDETAEAFTESGLREFFKAWVLNIGDPLTIYVTYLHAKGFRYSVSITGEPTIFVRRKQVTASLEILQ